jgi:hypothetical protein
MVEFTQMRRRYLTGQRQLEHAKMWVGRQFLTKMSASLQSGNTLEITLGALQMINQQVVTLLAQKAAGYVAAQFSSSYH